MPPILTFSSEFESNNPINAVLYSQIKSIVPQLDWINLYQNKGENIDSESIGYKLLYAFQHFPQKSIHVFFGKHFQTDASLVLCKYKDQIAILPNNGIVAYLEHLDYQSPILLYSDISYPPNQWANAAISNIVFTIKKITEGEEFQSLGTFSYDILKKAPFNNNLLVYSNMIRSRLIYVNDFKNGIFNLDKSTFENTVGNKSFVIKLHMREEFDITFISKSYNDVNLFNIGAFFNEMGYLEVFMKDGKLCDFLQFTKNESNIQMNF